MRINLGIPLSLKEIGDCFAITCTKCAKISFISTDTRDCVESDLFISLSRDEDEIEMHTNQALKIGAYTISPSKYSTFIVSDSVSALGKIAKMYLTRLICLRWRIAITGSVGKTTTKEFLGQILGKKYRTHISFGNFNNEIGTPLSILTAPRDTEVIVLEIGMNHSGEIARLSNIINPDLGIITNIGTSHIGLLGSREAIARAKSEIVCGMNGGAVICPKDEKLLSPLPYRKTLSVQDGGRADYLICNVRQKSGYLVDFIYKGGVIRDITFNNIGEHLLWALGYSLAIGVMLGVSENDLREACKDIGPDIIRHKYIECKDLTILDDSYNSSIESVEADIRMLLYNYPSFSFVLGDILESGDMAEKIHERLGEIAGGAEPNFICYVGDNGEFFIRGAVKSGYDPSKIICKSIERFAEIADFIKLNYIKGETILFKASRRIGLERIIQLLQEKMK